MIHTLIFGGTTEGRQALIREPDAVVCVTSDYARSLLPPGTDCRVGALNRAEMLDLMQSLQPRRVIDATHPYAAHITETLRQVTKELGIPALDGIVLDLGVSSYQLDSAERGFSYMQDAPLDMRMDRRESRTAADLVNEASEQELFRIIRDYGEERFAKNIAKHIAERRNRKRIETTGELVEIIRASIPMKLQKNGGHPAKRTFQAIRIELNGELSALEDSLDGMIDLLKDGGRLSVITFHSLEDRIVKAAFKRNENPCTCPPDFPVCVCGKKPKGFVVTRKPILPTEEEMGVNPRAKSAKLRVFERKV